ncbi:MAG: efflux RND transporter periplasmic adaptor subunit [Chlorobi bacterium]|nr:efflux RND transporter periplasmic adaptor subunit [Chlorobiota bacterium]
MKQELKNLLLLTMTFLLVGIGFSGCSGNEKKESKSLEQIQKEEGIPVVVKKIKPERFEKYLTFFGKFKGERETIVGAMIGGRIEKINYRPGDKVKKDDVILEFPKDSPASQFQQAQSAYENSKKTYERMKALYEQGEIAQAQFDGVKTKYLVDKRNFETMKDMIELDAPYDGTITELMVHEGDNVKSKKPLFTIAKLDRMKIRIWLSDSERMQIKKGMRAFATVDHKSFAGKVYELSFSVNPMKQAFYADLIFNNGKHEILAGTTADVKIIIYENDNAIVVARNLVKEENGKKFVFLENGDAAKKQYVTVSNENGLNFEISDGLKEGDPLIVKGSARLSEGVKIKVVK